MVLLIPKQITACYPIDRPAASEPQVMRLATTTSTADSGLLDAILPDFEQKFNARVDVVAVGTGQAIEIGTKGDADVILVHARARENKFVEEGHGINRLDVMYNDYILVGPTGDPAGVAGNELAKDALLKIAEAEAIFASRGDDSGTHIFDCSVNVNFVASVNQCIGQVGRDLERTSRAHASASYAGKTFGVTGGQPVPVG